MWLKLGIVLITQAVQISKFLSLKQFQKVPIQPKGISVLQAFLGEMNI